MINFDAVDFSEHRSEEVISFFWRWSVNFFEALHVMLLWGAFFFSRAKYFYTLIKDSDVHVHVACRAMQLRIL